MGVCITAHHRSLCVYVHHNASQEPVYVYHSASQEPVCARARVHAHTHARTHTHTEVSITPCPAPPLSLLSPFLPTRCPVCTPPLRALKLTSHYSAHYAATTLAPSVDSTLPLSSSEKWQQWQCLFVVEDRVRVA